jgi:hypothetical protein
MKIDEPSWIFLIGVWALVLVALIGLVAIVSVTLGVATVVDPTVLSGYHGLAVPP